MYLKNNHLLCLVALICISSCVDMNNMSFAQNLTNTDAEVIAKTKEPLELPPKVPKIINGTPAALGDYPHHVAIGISGTGLYRCGGTLISNQWVLSAAHCFKEYRDGGEKPSIYGAVIGEIELNSFKDVPVFEEIYIHDAFNGDLESGHDIALLKLATSFSLAPYPTIESELTFIAGGHEDVDTSVEYVTIGFGRTNEINLNSDILIESQALPAVTIARCRTMPDFSTGKVIYGDKIKKDMICVGNLNDASASDACNGDSGGPLLRSHSAGGFIVSGIVSWGGEEVMDDELDLPQDSCSDHPFRIGVYTNVAFYQQEIINCIKEGSICELKRSNRD